MPRPNECIPACKGKNWRRKSATWMLIGQWGTRCSARTRLRCAAVPMNCATASCGGTDGSSRAEDGVRRGAEEPDPSAIGSVSDGDTQSCCKAWQREMQRGGLAFALGE